MGPSGNTANGRILKFQPESLRSRERSSNLVRQKNSRFVYVYFCGHQFALPSPQKILRGE